MLAIKIGGLLNISNFFKIVPLILTLLIFFGCVTPAPSHISLKHESMNYINSTDVFIGFDDHEVIPYNESKLSTYTLGGLIPGVIDAVINYSQAKEQSKPAVGYIRDALEDSKFEQSFTEIMKLKLQSVNWLKVKEVLLANSASNKMYDVYYSLSKESAVLFITTRYSFSSDFKVLKNSSSIALLPKDNKLKSFAPSWSYNENNPISDNNCIYKNTIEHEKQLNKEVTTKEAAILLWANNNASLLRESIDSGISEITQMIATDLNTIANKTVQ